MSLWEVFYEKSALFQSYSPVTQNPDPLFPVLFHFAELSSDRIFIYRARPAVSNLSGHAEPGGRLTAGEYKKPALRRPDHCQQSQQRFGEKYQAYPVPAYRHVLERISCCTGNQFLCTGQRVHPVHRVL